MVFAHARHRFGKYQIRIMLQLLILLSLSLSSSGQMTIQVTSVPQLTPLFDAIYIAGSFNNWTAGDPSSALEQVMPGIWSITLPSSVGNTFECKFNRGNWTMVEGTQTGAFMENRSYSYTPDFTLQTTIAGWEDLGGVHSVTPNVRLLDSNFEIPQLNRTRRIWICLPEGYEESDLSYPVWYMHDGQNLFDMATSFVGEWEVDESLESMISAACSRSIIVGIDNGGQFRTDEYAPWINFDSGDGGEGEEYAQFIINTLKPFIDLHFRTLSDREHTVTSGSSLGGLISAYLILKYPGTFSKAALFSPALWFNHDEMMALAETADPLPGTRIYMAAGQNESATMVAYMTELKTILEEQGLPGQDIEFSVDPSGQHNEGFWGQKFPGAYEFLSGCISWSGEYPPSNSGVTVSPNPSGNMLHLAFPGKDLELVRIIDHNGRLVREISSGRSPAHGQFDIPISDLSAGQYTLSLRFSGPQNSGLPSPLSLKFIKN